MEDGIAKLVSDSTDMRCLMDDVLTLCRAARNAQAAGAAGQCMLEDCGPRRVIYQGRATWAFYRVYGDGYQGFVPATARYAGNGTLAPESGGGPTLGRRSRGDARDTDLTAINGGNYKEEQELGRSPDAMVLTQKRRLADKILPNALKLDYVKFGECIKRMYGVTGTFLPNPDGSGRWVGNRSDDKMLTITLDAKTYDMAALTREQRGLGGDTVGLHLRRDPDYRFRDQNGYSDTSYVASDLAKLGASQRFIEAVQVHETGNALAYLTGRSGRGELPESLAQSDPDDGIALENCVFGGRVTIKGKVTQAPE